MSPAGFKGYKHLLSHWKLCWRSAHSPIFGDGPLRIAYTVLRSEKVLAGNHHAQKAV